MRRCHSQAAVAERDAARTAEDDVARIRILAGEGGLAERIGAAE